MPSLSLLFRASLAIFYRRRTPVLLSFSRVQPTCRPARPVPESMKKPPPAPTPLPRGVIDLAPAFKHVRAQVVSGARYRFVRAWDWGFQSVGAYTIELDPVTSVVTVTGHVDGAPFEIAFPLRVLASGASVLACPTCGKNMQRRLLVLTQEGAAGCSVCFPPPDKAPSPAEVRAALEATSSSRPSPSGRAPSSSSRRTS